MAWHLQNTPSAFRPRVVLLMALGHFTNDLYAGFIAPILPVLIGRFGLSMALAGFLVTSRQLSGSLAQPLYGFLGDRLGRRWMLGLGPLFTISVVGLVGIAPNYLALIPLMILIGVGSGAFHPQGAVLAGKASASRSGLGMGIFISGGNLGVALAPWIIVPIVLGWGLRATLLAALPGFLVGVFLLLSERHIFPSSVAGLRSGRLHFAGHGFALVLLTVIASSRTVVITGMASFLPVLMQERGFTLMGAGGVLSMFLLSGALASMAGGYLGDRTNPRLVIGATILMAVPFLQVALRVQGMVMMLTLSVGAILLEASASLNTVMAQRLAPASAGTASSLTMGVAYGIGGVGATLVGHLADTIGLNRALIWLCWIPLLAAALVLFLPSVQSMANGQEGPSGE
jgi:FSR family fosmidomycin resistance protein-like MFS transporter